MSETERPAAVKPPARLSRGCAALFKPFGREDRVLVIITADPDSIACAVALKRLLWRRVAHVAVASTNVVRRPDNLRLLKALKLNLMPLTEVDQGEFTKLAMVDSQPHHNPLTADLRFALVVDHHPVGHARQTGPAPEFSDIRSDYGATATIFFNYLQGAKIRPNHILATALFYAIKTDTQNFVRQGQIEDMQAFRSLYPLVHLPLLSDIERAPIDRRSFKVLLKALNQVVFHKNYASVFFDKLDHADTLVLAADFVMQIHGVNRAAACGVHDGKLVVVLRSGGVRSSNLGRLAQEAFGAYGSAGGHKNMARAEMDLAELLSRAGLKPAQFKTFVARRLKEALDGKPLNGDKGEASRPGATGQGGQTDKEVGEEAGQAGRAGKEIGKAAGQAGRAG
ncbi:MAG: DHH family phosphoesterase, partial [Deltaproteobacteria bacterium]|nr:DHH family phosphoesterase [Deltaproteobacteria bacterium]